MKLRLEQISEGDEEVIVRYRQMTLTVQAISDLLAAEQEKILGRKTIRVNAISYWMIYCILKVSIAGPLPTRIGGFIRLLQA